MSVSDEMKKPAPFCWRAGSCVRQSPLFRREPGYRKHRAITLVAMRSRKPPSQTWRTFLENHAKQLVSVDFFTVPTIRFFGCSLRQPHFVQQRMKAWIGVKIVKQWINSYPHHPDGLVFQRFLEPVESCIFVTEAEFIYGDKIRS